LTAERPAYLVVVDMSLPVNGLGSLSVLLGANVLLGDLGRNL
jgi:hypothetical protein